MRNVLLLTVNAIKVTFRKKGSFFVYFVLPVVGLIMSMVIYGTADTNPLNIGVINYDDGNLSVDIIDSLAQIENFKLTQVKSDEVDRLLLDGKLSCAVVFPEGFSESFIAGVPKKVEVISLKGKEATAWIEHYIDLYAENIYMLVEASEGEEEMFDKLYEGYKEEGLRLSVDKIDDQATDRVIAMFSMGLFIMFVMIGASNTSEIILREKRNRTYFRICAAPVKPGEYVLSNIITGILIILVQICIVLALMKWVLHIEAYVSGWQMLLVLGAFGLVAIGINMMIVAFASSSGQVSAASTLVVTPTCMLGGCFWSVENMPEVMQRISYFTPQRWALDAIERLQRGASFAEVAVNLAVLLAFAAVFFSIVAYRFSIADDVRRFV